MILNQINQMLKSLIQTKNQSMKFAKYSKIAISLLALGAVIVVVGLKPNKPICPLDFEDKNEYVESAANWLIDYLKKNPEASSEEEVLKARADYLLEMGCVDMSSSLM